MALIKCLRVSWIADLSSIPVHTTVTFSKGMSVKAVGNIGQWNVRLGDLVKQRIHYTTSANGRVQATKYLAG